MPDSIHPPDALDLLLPRPRRVARLPGVCDIGDGSGAHIDVTDPRVRRAWERLLHERPTPADTEHPSSAGVPCTVHVREGAPALSGPGAYRLDIAPGRVTITGASPAGCFHALQTLRQLIPPRGHRLPACRIDDAPDLAVRGVLLDVSRGRVPTSDTLALLVDRLAALKINQVQLYIEQAFTFGFDPDICDPVNGLTPDDVRRLDDICRERFIDLVPAVAAPGHMGRILSLPRYRHLAEIEADRPWERMAWARRLRGLTLDILNPDSFQLVCRIWSEVLDVFSSPIINVCGDEPHDMGRGRSRRRLPPDRVGAAYVNWIARLSRWCAERGRTVQMWGDVLRRHPDALTALPRDVTVLHWGYDDAADYDAARRFVDAGLTTLVCPGTSGWKRILNAISLAERNMVTFARTARSAGASGMITTDWGDWGHFNTPACSLHGLALGASAAWSADARADVGCDRRFTRCVLGLDDASGIAHLRAASRIAETVETWRVLSSLAVDGRRGDSPAPDRESLDEAASAARLAQQWCLRHRDRAAFPRDLDELAIACRFTRLLADWITPIGRAGSVARKDRVGALRDATREYARIWRSAHKPSGLADIIRHLEALPGDARHEARCTDADAAL